MMSIAHNDFREAQVAIAKRRGRFPPWDQPIRRGRGGIFEWMGTPRNAVIRVCRVRNVHGHQPRHVAAHAIRLGSRMGRLRQSRMAGSTNLADFSRGSLLLMRVVTRRAPQPATARLQTFCNTSCCD